MSMFKRNDRLLKKRLESIGYPRSQKYTTRGMLQHVSAIGVNYVYHIAIKAYLQQLYCNDEKMLIKLIIPITPSIGQVEMQAPDKKRKIINNVSNAEKCNILTIRHTLMQAPGTQSEALKQLIDLRIKLKSKLK